MITARRLLCRCWGECTKCGCHFQFLLSSVKVAKLILFVNRKMEIFLTRQDNNETREAPSFPKGHLAASARPLWTQAPLEVVHFLLQ